MRDIGALLAAVALTLGLALALDRYAARELTLVVLTLAAVAPVVYLALDRARRAQDLAALKEAALHAEVQALKAQIHPHFLFNTLNNLYALVVSGSDKAPDTVLRLSELLRFTIYEGQKDTVRLADEIDYLNSYLSLNRLRHGEALSVRFDTKVEDPEAPIPPLLLILLVENAFKHGVAAQAGAFVHLSLTAAGGRLCFEVSNSVAPAVQAPGGVGLANLRRRLALRFPNRHSLDIQADSARHLARLTLEAS